MKIARTTRFKKAWEYLTEKEKTLARKAIANLTADIMYPALRAKRIKGTKDIWEARASRSLRMTFQIEGDSIVLRNIGAHDKTLRQP